MAWQARLSLAAVQWARPPSPLGLGPKIERAWERWPGRWASQASPTCGLPSISAGPVWPTVAPLQLCSLLGHLGEAH